MSIESIARYTPPTRFDKSPFGTIVKVILSDDGSIFKYYIQIGDQDEMEWVTYGEFLEIVMENSLEDNKFMSVALDIIKDKHEMKRREEAKSI